MTGASRRSSARQGAYSLRTEGFVGSDWWDGFGNGTIGADELFVRRTDPFEGEKIGKMSIFRGSSGAADAAWRDDQCHYSVACGTESNGVDDSTGYDRSDPPPVGFRLQLSDAVTSCHLSICVENT